jgi:hypothetical protein
MKKKKGRERENSAKDKVIQKINPKKTNKQKL